MDEQRQDDQLEPIYNSFVQKEALKTCREWLTIEMSGKRGSGRSVLAVWYNDDNICIRILPSNNKSFKTIKIKYIDFYEKQSSKQSFLKFQT